MPSNINRKKGKKGRKIGKGIFKLAHSKWGTYAALINHQSDRRAMKLLRRYCFACRIQFHSRAVLKRHECSAVKGAAEAALPFQEARNERSYHDFGSTVLAQDINGAPFGVGCAA